MRYLGAIALFAAGLVCGWAFAMYLLHPPVDAAGASGWVQAVGSISAIGAAIWIASEQHRREVTRRTREGQNSSYLLQAELAWLGHEVVDFLNRFFDTEANKKYTYAIRDDDVADLLDRISWCRQRAEHKGQLAMLGTFRGSLMNTVRLIRVKEGDEPKDFSQREVDSLDEWRKDALAASNSANGIAVLSQYQP